MVDRVSDNGAGDTERTIAFSVVVPLFNEEENVRPLYDKLRRVMDEIDGESEVIFVDDGSADGTLEEIRRLTVSDPRVRCLRFRKNYGQTAAMQAGFDYSRGDVIVSMDGDLQNDPGDIPRFLEKIEEGYGVVCGWRKDRKDKAISRKLPSKIANRLIRFMTGVRIHDTGCSLKAYRAEVIRNARLYAEMHRFIPAILSLSGSRIAEIVVTHHPRKYGTSKYGISRTWKVMSDLIVIKMITGFSKQPALWYGLLSLPFMILGGGALVLSLLAYFTAPPSEGFPVVFPSITALFAFATVHLLFLGLLTELVVATAETHDAQYIACELIDE